MIKAFQTIIHCFFAVKRVIIISVFSTIRQLRRHAMSFKISLINGLPVWDSLPVAKIVNYPLEKRDYKPFVQARLCISEQSVWVRMWAFEALPSETSTLMVNLNLFPELSDKYLSMSASYGGLLLNEVCGAQHIPMAEYLVLPRVKSFQSEDLQGIYWGIVFELPRTLLTKVYGSSELAPGKLVKGNLYKVDKSDCSEHYGCFYNVDFLDKNAYTDKYFGDFELVAY